MVSEPFSTSSSSLLLLLLLVSLSDGSFTIDKGRGIIVFFGLAVAILLVGDRDRFQWLVDFDDQRSAGVNGGSSNYAAIALGDSLVVGRARDVITSAYES